MSIYAVRHDGQNKLSPDSAANQIISYTPHCLDEKIARFMKDELRMKNALSLLSYDTQSAFPLFQRSFKNKYGILTDLISEISGIQGMDHVKGNLIRFVEMCQEKHEVPRCVIMERLVKEFRVDNELAGLDEDGNPEFPTYSVVLTWFGLDYARSSFLSREYPKAVNAVVNMLSGPVFPGDPQGLLSLFGLFAGDLSGTWNKMRDNVVRFINGDIFGILPLVVVGGGEFDDWLSFVVLQRVRIIMKARSSAIACMYYGGNLGSYLEIPDKYKKYVEIKDFGSEGASSLGTLHLKKVLSMI
ncbi:MAG: hypothetical protein CMK92_04980 [Pseudomonas sp.]|nr:hypothetical protein [Pseudomonas sp.]